MRGVIGGIVFFALGISLGVQAKCFRNPKTWIERCGNSYTTYAPHFYYRNGKFVRYYKKRKVAEIGAYKYDFKSGEWKTFYKNGKLKSKVTFFKGIHCDRQEFYDKQGKVLKRYIYMPCQQSQKFYAWPKAENLAMVKKVIEKHLRHPVDIVSGIQLEKFYNVLVVDKKLKKSLNIKLVKQQGSFVVWTRESDIEK